MSFVPTPRAPAGSTSKSNEVATNNGTVPDEISDAEAMFKMRTFDVFWVDKAALMYKDGIAKVRISNSYLLSVLLWSIWDVASLLVKVHNIMHVGTHIHMQIYCHCCINLCNPSM